MAKVCGHVRHEQDDGYTQYIRELIVKEEKCVRERFSLYAKTPTKRGFATY